MDANFNGFHSATQKLDENVSSDIFILKHPPCGFNYMSQAYYCFLNFISQIDYFYFQRYANADSKVFQYLCLHMKKYVEDFTLKHLSLFEICAREICEKFVYKHSETIC